MERTNLSDNITRVKHGQRNKKKIDPNAIKVELNKYNLLTNKKTSLKIQSTFLKTKDTPIIIYNGKNKMYKK